MTILGGGLGPGSFVFTYSVSGTNKNLVTDAIAAGWNKADALTVKINAGVTLSSTGAGTPALSTAGWPVSANTLILLNSGDIRGAGGAGGVGGTGDESAGGGAVTGGQVGGNAANGGDALRLVTIKAIINNVGNIWAGGGGGGGGGGGDSSNIGGTGGSGGGGGGGAGTAAGGGAAGGPLTFSGFPTTVGAPGSSGTASTGGSGGGGGQASSAGAGGTGGTGGAPGATGGTGAPGVVPASPSTGIAGAGGNGASGGNAIRLVSGATATFIAGNTGAQVKGAVGV